MREKKKKTYSLISHPFLQGTAFSAQLILATVFSIVFPLIVSLLMSFTNLKLSLDTFQFVGLANYQWVFGQASGFFHALGISALFSLTTTLLQTVLGFLLAVMLYFLAPRWQKIFKTLIYLPVILPSAVVSAMWIMMYSGDEYGILNLLFGLTNPPHQWLANGLSGFFALVLTNTWRYVGITMVVYLVNMCTVSSDIIESAKIDGASTWQIMTRILFPLTWEATKLNLILSLIGGMKSFDLFYLFQSGGTLPSGLTPVALLIYRIGLGNNDINNISLSKSVTMSIILALFLGILSWMVQKIASKKKEKSQ